MSMVPATGEQDPPPSPIQCVWKELHRRKASLRFGSMCAATLRDRGPLDPSLCSYAVLVIAESQMLQRHWSVKQSSCITYNSMGHNAGGMTQSIKNLLKGQKDPSLDPRTSRHSGTCL